MDSNNVSGSVVIIPIIAWNISYFQDAITSILQQTQRPDKVLIIFDVKGIESKGNQIMALKFQDFLGGLPEQELFTILENTKRQGSSATRNTGISHVDPSKTPRVFFLDEDDKWHPEKCAKQLALANDYGLDNVGIIGTNVVEVNEQGLINRRSRHPLTKDVIVNYSFCPFSTSSVLMPYHVLSTLGGFDETVSLCEDLDLYFRTLKKYSHCFFANIETELVQYRYHTGNASNQQWFQQRVDGLTTTIKSVYNQEHITLHDLKHILIKMALLGFHPQLRKLYFLLLKLYHQKNYQSYHNTF